MKKLIYVLLLAVTILAPVQRVDVGSLQPVEILSVSKEREKIVIQTDADDLGFGDNIEEAVMDLMETSTGVIYLDTVEFLLLEKECENEVGGLIEKLNNWVRVCYLQGKPSLKVAREYLRAHGVFPNISEWQKGKRLPTLLCEK